ncbi:MAG: hypothetical protein ACE5HA_08405, partial [Anaerolineae bacterium]
ALIPELLQEGESSEFLKTLGSFNNNQRNVRCAYRNINGRTDSPGRRGQANSGPWPPSNSPQRGEDRKASPRWGD